MPNSGATSDVTPPQVARVDVFSPTQMDLVFTEPMEKSSAEELNNYTIRDGVVLESAKLDSDLVRVHLKTSAHQAGQSYEIDVSNLRDLASDPNVLASDNPMKYLFAGGASMSDLQPIDYDWNFCHVNDSSYVDRDYTLAQIPECLDGSVQIMTANDDKLCTESKSITFELRGDATLYVAYDRHIETLPNWLSQWKPTGEQIVDSRSNVFQVYSKEIKNGRIEMGGNCGTMDDNMYLVFLVPHEANVSVLANLNRATYEVEHLSVGDAYYIDRDYTLAAIPESLEGLLWIKTANDDKADRDDEFLVFTLNQPSTMYIAYDENIASLPRWLMDYWDITNMQITDSRGTRFDVWARDFEIGEVVFGGNCGSMDDNMYTVMLRPSGAEEPGAQAEVPGYFTLDQNYPNPFNPETTIRYTAHKDGFIKLTVFNILGQQVKVLLEEDVSAGSTGEVVWDGTDGLGNSVASGVYFYRIEQKQFAKARRMLLMR